MQSVFTKPF